MQYVGGDGFGRIVVGGGVEGGKGHGHDDPVFVGVDAIDENDDDGDKEEEKQETPAFADLDKKFAEIFLDKVTAEDKGDDQPDDAQGDPDG